MKKQKVKTKKQEKGIEDIVGVSELVHFPITYSNEEGEDTHIPTLEFLRLLSLFPVLKTLPPSLKEIDTEIESLVRIARPKYFCWTNGLGADVTCILSTNDDKRNFQISISTSLNDEERDYTYTAAAHQPLCVVVEPARLRYDDTSRLASLYEDKYNFEDWEVFDVWLEILLGNVGVIADIVKEYYYILN